MSERLVPHLWVPLVVLYVGLNGVAVMFALRNEGEIIYLIATLPGFTALAIVGSVLASRRPWNPIGWLFLCGSVAAGGYTLFIEVAIYGLVTAPGSIPFAAVVGWLVLLCLQGFLIALAFAILLFPSGRLPSRRWRPVAFGLGLWGLASTAVVALGSDKLGPLDVANPFFVPALAALAAAANSFVITTPLAVAVMSLPARYRAGSAVEKQQLKWVVLAAVLMILLLVASGIPSIPSPVRGVTQFLSLVVLPSAIAIAILRYRLFDIDHLINRTLVYGATSGVIAVLFFVPIVGVQPLLRPFTSGSELEIAGLTLVAFALFQPIRRRIQQAVDRRFDRSRYDAARTLDALSDELRDEVDLERVEADLLSAVSMTMAPHHVSLWLRGPMTGTSGKAVTISGRPVVRKELA